MVANIDDMIATCKLHKHVCDINAMSAATRNQEKKRAGPAP